MGTVTPTLTWPNGQNTNVENNVGPALDQELTKYGVDPAGLTLEQKTQEFLLQFFRRSYLDTVRRNETQTASANIKGAVTSATNQANLIDSGP